VSDLIAALPGEARERLRSCPQPEWVPPMLATLTQRRFSSPDWIFERKLDGERCLAFVRVGAVRLLSRNRLSQNQSYPAVVEEIARLPARDVILDGEATGVWGKPGVVAYNVFDILWLNGRKLTSLPLDPAYTATKHAVIGWVRAAAPGLLERGIRLNALCPGFTDTPLLAAELRERADIPLMSAAFVAEAALRVLEDPETGHAWVVQPNRVEPFRFPGIPGPR